MKARRGFTLVELLLVVMILGILVSIVVPRMTGAAAAAKTATCDANWANLIRALELYAVYNDGEYPAAIEDILNLTYFPHGIPVCPYGDGVTTHLYEYDDTPGEETVTQHIH